MFAMAFAVGCGGDDEDAASDAAANLQDGASDMMNKGSAEAGGMADHVQGMAHDAAGAAAASAVDACRKFAESGAWEQALDACSKAHEMLPDDLGLEHAFQQAQAAAGQ